MLKTSLILFAKVCVIYVAAIVLRIDLILLEASLPRFLFEQQPFMQSSVLVLAVSGLTSFWIKSRTPVIFTVVCIAYSATLSLHLHLITLFIGFFCAIAALSFLFRNRITEPFLSILLVFTGVWVFASLIYTPYLVAWANYITGRKDLIGSMFEGFISVKEQVVSVLIIAPVIAMYFLGKHGYVKFYEALTRAFGYGKRALHI